MNTYRRTAMAVITCAIGLSLAACTVGITTARSGPSPSPTASRTDSSPTAIRTGSSPTAPSSHSAPPPPGPATMVPVDAPIGSFPVPKGAKVAYNFSCPKQINIAVTPVTPSQSSIFYTAELPRAGYKMEDNFAAQGLVQIDFSGHGYKGSIVTVANLGAAMASADPSIGPMMPSGMTKNVEQIMMTVPGVPASYQCPS
jgi:hypothetical protein